MARINVENPVANRARHTTSRPALTMGKIRMKIPVEQTDTFDNVEEFNPLPGLKDDKEDDSDDKCGEWVTLVEEEPDIIDIMKLLTKNWTWVNWNKKFNTRCNCPTRVKTSRMIDLVDLHTQHRIRVEFCGCTPDAIWLLRRGYLAGSPVVPQTAFSLPLLIFHNGWLHAENRKHARDMRRPFTAAVDMYRQLERIFESVVFSALGLQPQQILANLTCPACFGPQPLNTSPYPETTRNRLCVCLDANFQQCHHIKASRNHKRLQTPRIFLAQEEVDQTTEMIQKEEMEDNTPEKLHKAANNKRNALTWKGCDDTGLMGCCCQHDAAIFLTNIHKSGEKRVFPLAILQRLLSTIEPTLPVGVLYDIGCSLDKYINLRNLLPEDRARIKYGTSVFHAYVHNWACQLDYHPRFNKGWGLSELRYAYI
ncbi:hypothetical protein PSTG_10272 [Puccinia striiformis f. sp. tritici PST-78]|uniref:CxC1-like cysteine cluster associated with KDZ transposases domain-containing protein n=1 Tax=Puccinia striiformis f. sp. tritici PST-78 TaxID=1165861 RepID=A0A0L0VB45_9BASI|nr:hypothetical protein PSTG_10272 [Puccinia striiformis f. sp. tritici PST-78]